LLEAVVFGRRAGTAAAADSRDIRPSGLPERVAGAVGGGTLSAEDIGAVLQTAAGPLRTGFELWSGLDRLDSEAGASPHAEAVRLLARLVLRSALDRDESRGAHVRTDHPRPVAEWARWEQVATLSGVALRPRRGEEAGLAAGA
jgi:L-aspartate oxidase